MPADFVVRQHQLNLGQCERLCSKWSFDIERLLGIGGHHAGSGEPTLVPLGSAINLLIRSKVVDAGFEPTVVNQWLPSLRNETLLVLGEDVYAWACTSSPDAWKQFLPKFYGQSEDVRPRIAGYLGCCLATTAATVRLYSANDVQTFGRYEDTSPRGGSGPRLTIRADDLADKIRQVCGRVLFTVHPREAAIA